MRTLVVGTVPPPGGPFARSLGVVAARLVADGHEVEVLSPDERSAAHRHPRLSGPMLGINLIYLARRFDAVVVRIEPEVPLGPSSGRAVRAVSLLSLGIGLRLFKDVTLRLDSPVPLPGGLGGRATQLLWAHTTKVVVADEEDCSQLLLVKGMTREKVTVEPVSNDRPDSVQHGWKVDPDSDLRSSVLSLVRARAVEDRNMNTARIELGSEPSGPLSSSSLAASTRPTPSRTALLRFGVHRAKRAVKALRGRSS